MKRTIRYIDRIIATLMALLLLLTCPVSIPVRAASESSADRDDITVLSITVNVNTETRMVFTELILSNNGEEDAELTFPLPEISAGIDGNALTVKTKDGQDVEADDGVVSLTVPAGGYAGLSYAYKTKKNLSYEGPIAFDLRQLTRQFNDRIGHIEWTVDMPLYELVLVKEIQPANYMVKDNRVSVVLDDFTVCRLLDRISLSRTTHAGLLEEAEESKADSTIAQFIIENYRKWYRNPSAYIDQLILFEDWDDTYGIDRDMTLLNMYLAEQYSPEEREELIREIQLYNSVGGYYEESMNHDKDTLTYLKTVTWKTITPNTMYLFDDWLWTLGQFREDVSPVNPYYSEYSPAFEAMLTPTAPEVYVILMTPQPALAGEKLGVVKDFEGFNRIEINPADEMTLLKVGPSKGYYLEDDTTRYAYVYLNSEDVDDPQAFRDYLSFIHAKAVVRSQIVMKDSEIFKDTNYPWDHLAYYAYAGTETYPYEQFSEDLLKAYVKSIQDLFGDEASEGFFDEEGDSYYLLSQCEEPLIDELSIPIFTLYWGYAFPVEEVTKPLLEEYRTEKQKNEFAIPRVSGSPLSDAMLVYPFETCSPDAEMCGIGMIRYLMEQPIPKQLLENREEEVRKAESETAERIAAAREELNLPASDVLIEDLQAGNNPTEAPTEAPTEVPTEEPTEAPTEEPTEATTEESVEATTEATTESTTEAATEPTTEAATEKETEPSTAAATEAGTQQASEESSGGNGLLIVLIIALTVVGLGGTTAAVIMLKKNKKNE